MITKPHFVFEMLWPSNFATITFTGALTADVDYVYGDVMEEYYQDGLPDPGTWIACEVSAIINPAHFYIVLPFGKEPLASLEPAKKEGIASVERVKIPRCFI